MKDSEYTGKAQITSVLNRCVPARFVYAPNYWQWFAHQCNHQLLPGEAAHCRTQLDLIRHLGLDVFSRNIYSDEQQYWFGGLAEEEWRGIEVHIKDYRENGDRLIQKIYRTRYGELTERLRYDYKHSTLIQEKFLIDDYEKQVDALEEIILARHWKFNCARYKEVQGNTGADGIVIAGELHSPLKMLHFFAGPVAATYFLTDYPERSREILKIHEDAQLDLVRQMANTGVAVVMSMDNLDTMFHPPSYVEKYSASFYEKASRICHEYGSVFFIHACGRQRDNLALISSLGVDGLEGAAFPPLGDIELDEAMRITGDRFIITGGISAIETRDLTTREQVYGYVKELFKRMKPYANRFIFSASCNTSINTNWDTIKYFRDAWLKYGEILY